MSGPPPLRSLKSLGQHFLVDKGIVRRIVSAAEVKPGETVLEIGPGRGILTDALLEAGARVTALEVDRGLYTALCERYAVEDRLALHHVDALKFDPSTLPAPYKVVANLPYQITTPLLFHLLEAGTPPARMVVMIQQEVAERMVAAPGGKAYGVLSLGVQVRATVTRLFTVPPGAFRPPPKVKSAVVDITPLPSPPVSGEELERFMAVVRAALGTRRKTIKNALKSLLPTERIEEALSECGIDPRARGETVDRDAYLALARTIGRT